MLVRSKRIGEAMIDAVKRGLLVACVLVPIQARAESATSMVALKGLAPVSALPNSSEGKAALAANLAVTGGIQTGTLQQPTLMPFADQQAQALKDAFITDGNATELSDALGTKLGDTYGKLAHYEDFEHFTSVAKSVADLIAYTNATTKADSNAGKYFFANLTTDGKKPVSETVAAILASSDGVTDVFGKAYGREAGGVGADAYGNSRPFQTEPHLVAYRADDYFGKSSHSFEWLRGPNQNLADSPSYPSGHTTYGYTESLLLAILVPERYQQMVVRGAEYGNDRIIVGAHYAMDVLGGRTLAMYDVAHLLANDPSYVGRSFKDPAAPAGMSPAQKEIFSIADYPAAVKAARGDIMTAFESACGDKLAVCATADTSRFKDAAANQAFYEATQTYSLPVVHQATASATEDVAKIAPEAGYLLTIAFPSLSLAEADDILTATEGPGGGFLDDGSAFGLYSRLNLYAAAGQASTRTAAR